MLQHQDVAERETHMLDLTSLASEEFISIVAPIAGLSGAYAAIDYGGQTTHAAQLQRLHQLSAAGNPKTGYSSHSAFSYALRQSYHGATFGAIQSSVSTWLNFLILLLQTVLSHRGGRAVAHAR
jgi:hypothetical protein